MTKSIKSANRQAAVAAANEQVTQSTESLTLEGVLHDLPANGPSNDPVTVQDDQQGQASPESASQSSGTNQAASTGKQRGLQKGAIVFRGETWDDKVQAACERIVELKETLANTEQAYKVLLASEAKYRELEKRKQSAGQRVLSAVERITTVSDSDEILIKNFMHNRALKGNPISREEAIEMLGLA